LEIIEGKTLLIVSTLALVEVRSQNSILVLVNLMYIPTYVLVLFEQLRKRR